MKLALWWMLPTVLGSMKTTTTHTHATPSLSLTSTAESASSDPEVVMRAAASSIAGDVEGASDSNSPYVSMEMFSNDEVVWYVDVIVGGQDQSLRVDIVQPNLWVLDGEVFPACSDVAASIITTTLEATSTFSEQVVYETVPCHTLGAYNLSDSEKGVAMNEQYGETFIDYVSLNGSLVEDSFTLVNVFGNNSAISKQEIGIQTMSFLNVNQTNVVVGGFGLGTPSDADSYLQDSILQKLVDQEVISYMGYSMASVDNQTGRVVFGAVDTELYTGPLVQFDNIGYALSANVITHQYPIVPLSGMTVNNDKGVSAWLTDVGSTIPVLLDTRTTFLYLPYAYVVSVAIQLNGFYSDTLEQWFVKCSVGDVNASIGFKFGNLTVDVPVDQLIRQISDTNGTDVSFEDGTAACMLAMLPDNYYGYSVLGTPFTNSVFLAVDNEGQKVAMAQADNESYKAHKGTQDPAYSDYNTSSTASQTSTDNSASQIRSGYIPFAVTNNITDTLTLSYLYQTAGTAFKQTALYTSGQLFTGRALNSTTNSFKSTSSATGGQMFAGAGPGAYEWTPTMFIGLLSTMFAVLLGIFG